jgi:hypothetical protein
MVRNKGQPENVPNSYGNDTAAYGGSGGTGVRLWDTGWDDEWRRGSVRDLLASGAQQVIDEQRAKYQTVIKQ